MGLAVLVSVFLQQDETIPKASRQLYAQAVKDCGKARDLISGNPQQAVQILSGILEDSKIEKRECRLRLEYAPGDYSDWYEFYPYHYRGQALAKLAEKEADPDRAKTLLGRAIVDLKDSVARGRKESATDLKAAEERLKKLNTPRVEPEPEFRKTWQGQVDGNRFAAAKEHVRSKGGFLTEAARKRYEEDTDRACRAYVDGAAREFARRIPAARKETLALPPQADLSLTTPALDWCRSSLRILRDGALADLLDQAVAAIPLVETGENPWFTAMERLAIETVREGIADRAAKARDAPAEERRKIRAEAESLRAQWKSFRDRSQGRAESREFPLDGFPIEDDPIPTILADLRTGLLGEKPDPALADLELTLQDLRAEERWPRRALERRQDVVRYQIVVGGLRGFLAGKEVDDVARELHKLGRDLKELKGELLEGRFGGKVEELFARLR